MKRLVRTSKGWLLLDVSNLGLRSLGTSVRAAVFGEGGWASAAESWNSRWSEDETLAAFLSRIAGIPEEEAEQLGAATFSEWRKRGGDDEGRRETLGAIRLTLGVFVLAAIGGVAAVAAAAVAAWRLLL